MFSKIKANKNPLRFALSFAIFSLVLALIGAVLIIVSIFCFEFIKARFMLPLIMGTSILSSYSALFPVWT